MGEEISGFGGAFRLDTPAYFNYSSQIFSGGAKYIRWWKNKVCAEFVIKDGCTTEVSEYLAELRKNANHYWELHSDDWRDRVTVKFIDPKDAAYFKMLWG